MGGVPVIAPPIRKGYLEGRALILRSLRREFDRHEFIEIEPSTMVPSPGMEPHLDAFELRCEDRRRFLHTSPEYSLKKVLALGCERIFSIVPCYRDEPLSPTHRPEFTLLEWYSKGLDLFGLMDQTESIFAALWDTLNEVNAHRQSSVAFDGPFERLSVRDAFQQYANLDPWTCEDATALQSRAREVGLRVSETAGTWDDFFFEIFLNAVEPKLGLSRPCFLWGWPASQAALARLDPADMTRALRFELFAGGFELANAFDELIDPREQRLRFEADQIQRGKLGKPIYPIDNDLLEALSELSPTSGIALGVDRLVMLLLGAEHIDHVRATPW